MDIDNTRYNPSLRQFGLCTEVGPALGHLYHGVEDPKLREQKKVKPTQQMFLPNQ